MKRSFTHLHLHSNGSLLDGLIKIKTPKDSARKELVDRIKEMGQDAVGITDHGNMSRAIELYTTCHENGVLPIIGTEFYIIDGNTKNPEELTDKDRKTYHITVMAKNTVGYYNLIKLNTYAAKHFYRKPKIDYDVLIEHKEGLIVLSGCPSSQIYYAIMNQDWVTVNRITKLLKDAFGEDFYMEIQENNLNIMNDNNCMCSQGDINGHIFNVGKEYGIKSCPTGDAHYLYRDDSRAHEIALAISTGATLDVPTRQEANEIAECGGQKAGRFRMKFDDYEYYVKDRNELSERFSDEVLDVTLEITEKCREDPVEINMPGKKFDLFSHSNMEYSYLTPKYESDNSIEFLKKLCYEGYEQKIGDVPNRDKYIERLEHELKVIIDMDFTDYFLIVWDIMEYAKSIDILVGPGRGSSGGSLICFCISITEIDPLKYDLLFSRFLNTERVSMPDIDLDFESARRGEIFKYIEDKYGHDKVARIGTYMYSKGKLITNDVFRVYANELVIKNNGKPLLPTMITELIESDAGFTDSLTSIMAKEAFRYNVQPLIDSNQTFSEMYDIMRILEDNPKAASRHACGQLISSIPLDQSTPLMRAMTKEKDDDGNNIEEFISQYNMNDIDAVGLIKIDALGLETLDLLKEASSIVKLRSDVDINLSSIPLNDGLVFDFLCNSNSYEGLFQMSNPGFVAMIRSMKPDCIEDLMAAAAMYRPGPLRSGATAEYVRRKAAREVFDHEISKISEILRPTQGVLIYQEQIQRICQVVCGWTLGRADSLRKIIGKKLVDKIEGAKKEFVKDALAHSTECSKQQINNLWNTIETFAKYGFNASHATAYGLLAYRTAWVKAHFPVEFCSATMTSCFKGTNTYINLVNAIDDARDLGIRVLPPCVNNSDLKFTVIDDNRISYGLALTKNLGLSQIDGIIEARENFGEFTSFKDFMMKVDVKLVNKRALEALIKCGAFNNIETRNKNVLIQSLGDWAIGYKEQPSGKVQRTLQKGMIAVAKILKSEKNETKRKPLVEDDLIYKEFEEQTPEDFFAKKKQIKIIDASYTENILMQIESINFSFQRINKEDIPDKYKTSSFGLTSTKNILNKLKEAAMSIDKNGKNSNYKINRLFKDHILDRNDLTSNTLTATDFNKYKINNLNPNLKRSYVAVIYGLIRTIELKTAKSSNKSYYIINMTDGPSSITAMFFGNNCLKMMKNIEKKDMVCVLISKAEDNKSQDEEKIEKYYIQSIIKAK